MHASHRSIILLILVVYSISRVAAATQGPGNDITKDLEANLRTLEKEIAAVRGLEFKSPVKAQIIPRPAEASKNIQGYYDSKVKSLFLYEDIKGSYQKGVLIHEMVHALQDQHFDLAKLKAALHSESYNSDAELALAALIEGDATYTMIEVLKKENPKVAAMLDAPLAKSKNLQNAFLYAQGARYVKAMKDRGGWMTVNFSYKFPPRNTATIFGTYAVSGIDLGPGKVQGAYAIYKMLNDNKLTADLAEPTARAWRGDRTRDQECGRSTVVACASKESAVALYAGLAKLKDEQELKPRQKNETGNTWIAADKSIHGVLLRGQRVWTLVASSEANYAKLLDQLDGPPKTTVYSVKDKRHISFGEMAERLLDADLICVGETHDSEVCHRVQLQIIKSLAAYDDRLGVGMEMFQRPFQKELDRYIKGETTEEEFLKASEYKQRWGYDWSLYQPIVEYCRINKLPLAALNAPKELTGRISKVGVAKLTDEEKKQLGPIDFEHKEHRDHWYERLAKMHGADSKTPAEQKERSYQVMTTWDGFMAQSAARFQQERSLRRLVVLAGSGHIDRRFGIPQRASKLTGGKAATIRVEVEGAAESTIAEPVTDFIVIVSSICISSTPPHPPETKDAPMK